MASEGFTLNEIRDVPSALRRVLNLSSTLKDAAVDLNAHGIKHIMFTGCGSSYYASLVAMYTSPSRIQALPASEFIFHRARDAEEGTALIGLSRSGSTSETIAALQTAKERGLLTVALTCSSDAPMNDYAHVHIFVDVGEERSVVMTKTFCSLSLAATLIAKEFARIHGERSGDAWQPEHLPRAASEALMLEDRVNEIASVLAKKEAVFFLGQGPAYPVALEGALKLMETSRFVTSTIRSLEFRHGPISAVDERTGLLIVALNDSSSTALIKLEAEIKQQGLSHFLISNLIELDNAIKIPWQFDARLAPPIAIIPLQLLAYHISISKGLNPDRPQRLSKFVGGF